MNPQGVSSFESDAHNTSRWFQTSRGTWYLNWIEIGGEKSVLKVYATIRRAMPAGWKKSDMESSDSCHADAGPWRATSLQIFYDAGITKENGFGFQQSPAGDVLGAAPEEFSR